MRAKDPVNDNDLVNKGWLANLYATIVNVLKNSDNIMLNAFRIAINGSLSFFNMIDGFVDEYEDDTGIDATASLNESYDSGGDFYEPTGGVPVSASPYAHFKCNDDAANTTVTDDGTGSNNGVASVNTSVLSVPGKINDAFDFDASKSVNIDALQQDIETDTTGSITFWVRVGSFINEYIFTLNDTGGPDTNFGRIRFKSDGKLNVFITGSGTTVFSWLSDAIFSIDTWYHIAVVQNGTAMVVYVNGAVHTGTWEDETDKGGWFDDMSAAAIDNGRLGCGNDSAGGDYAHLNGEIDDFRYYQNTDISDVDVLAIYNSGGGSEAQNPTGAVNNMTLISESVSAEADPDNGRIVILEEDVSPITLNTDIKAYASKDDGSTWAQITLSDEGDYDASKRILVGNADLDASGIGSGTDMVYKIESLNAKQLKIHGTALSWGN